MPYELKKVKGGWKVQKKGGGLMSNGRRFASDKPLTEEKAKKQMAAMYIQEKTYQIKRSPKGKLPPLIAEKFHREGRCYKVCRQDGRKLRNGRYHSTNKFLTYDEAKREKRRLQKMDRETHDSSH
ncbi:MAG: hypothetical protein S4CHLAM20_14790 [Chlamydiia bacterium]|nr:hypothetical protein [Chlamydiia bacterium]